MQIVHYVTRRRNNRPINSDGTVLCAGCKVYKHLTEFYLSNRIYVAIEDTKTNETIWYGKPHSNCIECDKAYQKATRQHLDAMENQRLLDAYFESRKPPKVVVTEDGWKRKYPDED